MECLKESPMRRYQGMSGKKDSDIRRMVGAFSCLIAGSLTVSGVIMLVSATF